MANCCEDKSCEITAMREAHGKVLWVVLAINALMFVVEGWAGVVAHSTSLLADALDMLGDAAVYREGELMPGRSRSQSCWCSLHRARCSTISI